MLCELARLELSAIMCATIDTFLSHVTEYCSVNIVCALYYIMVRV